MKYLESWGPWRLKKRQWPTAGHVVAAVGPVLGSMRRRPWGTESVCVVPTLLPLCVALGRMTWRQGRLWGHEFGGDTELLRPAGSRSGKPLLPDLDLRAPCGQEARIPDWPAPLPGAPVAQLPLPPPFPWARGAGLTAR